MEDEEEEVQNGTTLPKLVHHTMALIYQTNVHKNINVRSSSQTASKSYARCVLDYSSTVPVQRDRQRFSYIGFFNIASKIMFSILHCNLPQPVSGYTAFCAEL